jgi:anthranilate synthase component 2
MAFVHPHYKLCGIQFHPESILTFHGMTILKNWIKWIGTN